MRIQELEKLVGIERATIRFYEKEGLISPKRSENGYRDYSEEDLEELKRIRLLRELGVSLDTILALQAGTEDFASVMELQIRILQGRRDRMERAMAVCQRISADGATYAGLDTGRYQRLLETPRLPEVQGQGSGAFQEREYRTPHPWRRYFARALDHYLLFTALWFIIVVVLRIRPVGEVGQDFTGYLCWFLLMPLEAACLHFWSATPGKRLLGIRVEAAEGGKLRYSDALVRAWKVFRHGMFLGIPLVNLYCMYRGYKDHTEKWDTMWDGDCEVSYRKYGWKNIAACILVFALAFSLNVVSVMDGMRPGYRSDDLTKRQFISNYNFYNDLLMDNSVPSMNRQGQVEKSAYVQSYGDLEYDPYGLFEYHVKGSDHQIEKILFRHTWYQSDPLGHTEEKEMLRYWIPWHVQLAAITAVMSQSGEPWETLEAYRGEVLSDMGLYTPDGFSEQYGDVTLYWHLSLEKVRDYAEEAGYSDIYEVKLYFEIEF